MKKEMFELDHKSLYRLPWTLPDNGISGLNPHLSVTLAVMGATGKISLARTKNMMQS